jgi:hypothetical protein
MATVLHEQQQIEVAPLTKPGAGLWIDTADLERVTGFVAKPEGLCRDALCVPVPRGAASFVDGNAVDVAAFWRHMGNPVVSSADRSVWALGAGAGERARALDTLEAPDFTLPDIDGRPYTLSEQRGRKVFLATWASW